MIERFRASDKSTRKLIDSGEIVYVGRKFAGLEATSLGNPIRPKKGELPGSTLPEYKKWLWVKILEEDADVLNLLLEVYFKRKVACWCKLEDPCHADIVSAAADWVYSGDFLKKRMERVK